MLRATQGRDCVHGFLPKGDGYVFVKIPRDRRPGLDAGRVRHPNLLPLLSSDEPVTDLYRTPLWEMLRYRLTESYFAYPVAERGDVMDLWISIQGLTQGPTQGPTQGQGTQGTMAHVKHIAKRIIQQIAQGLQALHNAGFAHLDIKPENVVVYETRVEGVLVGSVALIDFDSTIPKDELVFAAGTDVYNPPELHQRFSSGSLGYQIDVFQLGATAYTLLAGTSTDMRDPSWIDAVRSGYLATQIAPVIGTQEAEFVAWCMAYNPADRPTMEQILASPFFEGVATDQEVLDASDLCPSSLIQSLDAEHEEIRREREAAEAEVMESKVRFLRQTNG